MGVGYSQGDSLGTYPHLRAKNERQEGSKHI